LIGHVSHAPPNSMIERVWQL